MKADTRGFCPRLRRPHRVAGHADDPIALAEKIKRLGRLLGQADDALRIGDLSNLGPTYQSTA